MGSKVAGSGKLSQIFHEWKEAKVVWTPKLENVSKQSKENEQTMTCFIVKVGRKASMRSRWAIDDRLAMSIAERCGPRRVWRDGRREDLIVSSQ